MFFFANVLLLLQWAASRPLDAWVLPIFVATLGSLLGGYRYFLRLAFRGARVVEVRGVKVYVLKGDGHTLGIVTPPPWRRIAVAEGLEGRELEAIVAHELAHIRQGHQWTTILYLAGVSYLFILVFPPADWRLMLLMILVLYAADRLYHLTINPLMEVEAYRYQEAAVQGGWRPEPLEVRGRRAPVWLSYLIPIRVDLHTALRSYPHPASAGGLLLYFFAMYLLPTAAVAWRLAAPASPILVLAASLAVLAAVLVLSLLSLAVTRLLVAFGFEYQWARLSAAAYFLSTMAPPAAGVYRPDALLASTAFGYAAATALLSWLRRERLPRALAAWALAFAAFIAAAYLAVALLLSLVPGP